MKTLNFKRVHTYFVLLLGLAVLQPVHLFAQDTPFVEEIKDKKWEKDTLSFGVYFDNTTVITSEMRKDFKLKITYTYNSEEMIQDVSDYSAWPQDYPKTTELFYLDRNTSVSNSNYLVYLKLNDNYKGQDYPKNFFELDDKKKLTVELFYGSSRFSGQSLITFERQKDEKYFLGNKAYAEPLKVSALHEKVEVEPQESEDPLLVFKHNGSEIVDSEVLGKEGSKSLEYVLIDVTGKKGASEDSYGTGSTVPDNAEALVSKAIVLEEGGALLSKAADEVWADVFDGMDSFKNEAKNQCYFVYPPSDLKVDSLYECVRCNFNDNDTEPNSDDKAYLILSSSFSDENKMGTQVKYMSGITTQDPQTISDLDNDKTYALLPLFKDKTLIRYRDNKDTASNNPTGASGVDSRIMCKLVKPEPNLTLGEYLGADPSETKKGDPRCFVVSAAFGSSLEKEVDVFRNFFT